MLTVHHLGTSQSERIVWLCEELELPYEFIRYEREPIGSAPPEYKALSPFGTAPTITDGDFSLGESGAIVEYICRHYADGRLIPGPDDPDFADYLFWFHFSNGSMMAGAMVDYMTGRLEGVSSEGYRPMGFRTARAFAIVEERLGQAGFFAGDRLTAADIMMQSALGTKRIYAPEDLGPCPNIEAYVQRIGERPAYRRAMAKAEPNGPSQLP